MNLLVVSQYYYPEQFRITQICEELVRRGHRVTVLTGRPNYPEGEIYPGYESIRREQRGGVEILRCALRPRKQGAVNLALNYLSFLVRGCWEVRHLPKNFDAVYVYQLSPITMAVPALYYKRRSGAPVYLYCLDLWPDSILDMVSGPRSPVFRLVRFLSRRIYNGADRVGITSRPFREYLKTVCNVPEEKIHDLPQHSEDCGYIATEDNGVMDFVFLGNVGIAQDLGNVAEAVKRVKIQKPFLVHIVGTGSALEPLKERVSALGVEEHFRFHGRRPLSEMPEYYRLADVCLLTLYDDNAAGLTLPGKLQGYMSAGKPVLAAANGAAAEVIRESGCGICVPAGDADALAEAMTEWIEHPQPLSSMGDRGRAWFLSHFSPEIHIASLERSLQSLVERKENSGT